MKLSFETGKCYFLVRPIIGISFAYVAAFSNQGSFIVILKREMEVCSIQPSVTTEDASLPGPPGPGLLRSGELPGGTRTTRRSSSQSRRGLRGPQGPWGSGFFGNESAELYLKGDRGGEGGRKGGREEMGEQEMGEQEVGGGGCAKGGELEGKAPPPGAGPSGEGRNQAWSSLGIHLLVKEGVEGAGRSQEHPLHEKRNNPTAPPVKCHRVEGLHTCGACAREAGGGRRGSDSSAGGTENLRLSRVPRRRPRPSGATLCPRGCMQAPGAWSEDRLGRRKAACGDFSIHPSDTEHKPGPT